MGDFRRLTAWVKAHELARRVHGAFGVRRSAGYPALKGQILRAVASIPANLAEGCAKQSRRELGRFADIAYGSAKEVESHLILARDVGALPTQEFEDLSRMTDEVARLCYGLARKTVKEEKQIR